MVLLDDRVKICDDKICFYCMRKIQDCPKKNQKMWPASRRNIIVCIDWNCEIFDIFFFWFKQTINLSLKTATVYLYANPHISVSQCHRFFLLLLFALFHERKRATKFANHNVWRWTWDTFRSISGTGLPNRQWCVWSKLKFFIFYFIWRK